MLVELLIKALISLLLDVVVNAFIKFILELCSALFTNYSPVHKLSLA